MHAPGNQDSLVYWLEFKSSPEFPTRQFGSISGGSALKFGLYKNMWPLVGPAQGSVTKIRQQLAQQHQIQLSDTTLRRYLTKLGYRPSQAKSAEVPVQDSKSSPAEEWLL
jgi:hypothetical protein